MATYESLVKENHTDLIIRENGIFIDLCHPYTGASPDGIISCSCCGKGVLEVKCPSCVKDSFPEDDSQSFCMSKQSDGNWTIKNDHPYYYQIQTQMHVCRLDYCDFVVWSEGDGILTERVLKDETFFQNIISDLEHFFVYGILPEIVGKWYTRYPAANSNKLVLVPEVAEDDDDNEDYEKLWCYCNQPSYGEMIFCDHTSCPIKWFHCDCLRIRKIPKGSWKCPSCRKLPKDKKTKPKSTNVKNSK